MRDGKTVVAILLVIAMMSFFAESGEASQATFAPPQSKVNQLLTLADGSLVALTAEKGGLYILKPGGLKWERWPGTPETHLYSAASAPDGALYLATASGLARWNSALTAWEIVREGAASRVSFSSSREQSRQYTMLVNFWGRGLAMLAWRQANEDDHQFELNPTQEEMKGLPVAPVQAILLREEDAWYAGLFGHGVFRFDASASSWETAHDGLGSLFVMTLAAGPTEELYVGTYGGGLLVLDTGRTDWRLADPFFAGTSIQDLAFGEKGEIVAGSVAHGLFLSLDKGTSWQRIDLGIPDGNITAVAVGKDGSIWAGVWGSGPFVSRDQGTSWRPVPID
ncbi:hypothetical protein [Desulfobulbus alkaliphilus]|uniref:hypothetical protein n=1 Tax=Desulfobulbus alkaliphilus TaxID=869814 RepID=UPI0019627F0D|nr:hypothetical protein [Desulfobulbus alkaliphilus]MBM9538775.1 hypothetical protein [Desulfobulbus alkaliphilus]